uniref:ATP synthase F0 subunit 8 n=1 Tax=Lens contradens TaxID=2771348 RepID=A0A8A3WFM9_9BIVA|nr:ATP synthase F0 subunit 8 [Lens contradens]
MPQFSPMSWLFISLVLVGVLVLMCVELWWCHANCYNVSKGTEKAMNNTKVWKWKK